MSDGRDLDALFAAFADADAVAPPRMVSPEVAALKRSSSDRRGPVTLDPARLPWPDSFLIDRDPGQARACRELWAATLLSVLRDVIADWQAWAKKKGIDTHPISWVGTSDFHIVCTLAGFDGSAIEAVVRRRVADPLFLQALKMTERKQKGDAI